MYKPKGIIPALATPFNVDGSIDYDGYYKYLDHLIEEGVHGLLIGGTTGEYTLLSIEERRKMIKNVLEYVDNRVPTIVGTSCHKTEDTIELTQYASKLGADIALVLPPHYIPTTREGVINYYKEVSDNSDIGIMIYHYPDATGIELDIELIYELSQIENVVSLKNTTNFVSTSKAIEVTKDNPDFTVLTGLQDLVLPTIAAGGDGAMCVIPGLVPREILKIYDLIVKDNDVKAAAELNKQLIPLYTYVDTPPFPGNLKAGLEALGYFNRKVQSPLMQADDEMKRKISKKLEELGYKVK